MEKSKAIGTPMDISCNLKKYEGGKLVEESIYQGTIDSLLYLNASHLDIMFVVCFCARF